MTRSVKGSDRKRADAMKAVKRLRRTMTVQALAEALDTGTATVQRWAHGQALPHKHSADRILRLVRRVEHKETD